MLRLRGTHLIGPVAAASLVASLFGAGPVAAASVDASQCLLPPVTARVKVVQAPPNDFGAAAYYVSLLGLCAVTPDGRQTMIVSGRTGGAQSWMQDGIEAVPVPKGYPNAGTFYVVNSIYESPLEVGVSAYNSDGSLAWRAPLERDDRPVGLVPPDQPGGGSLIVARSVRGGSSLVTIDPAGHIGQAGSIIPVDFSDWHTQATQAPPGTPGAGTIYVVDGLDARSVTQISPAGEVIANHSLPKAFLAGTTGPLEVAPAGAPNAGTVFGRTVNGNRCWAYALNPQSGRLRTWELTKVIGCDDYGLTIGQAGSPNAGYVYVGGGTDPYGNGGNRVAAVTPAGKIGLVKAVASYRQKVRSNRIGPLWTLPAPAGGLGMLVDAPGHHLVIDPLYGRLPGSKVTSLSSR